MNTNQNNNINESGENQKKLSLTSKEAFYQRLKEELDKNHEWPTTYVFKFIVPNDEEKIKELKKHFENLEHQFKQNFSRNGKYASLTFITQMENAEQIIRKYKEVEHIEGLIAL